MVRKPLPPLIVLVLDNAKMGSTSFKVMHYRGEVVPDAFATENLYKMDVWINGKSVTTMAGVTFKLNGGPLTAGDFMVGDMLEIDGIPTLAIGDLITVIYKPTMQALLEVSVVSQSTAMTKRGSSFIF